MCCIRLLSIMDLPVCWQISVRLHLEAHLRPTFALILLLPLQFALYHYCRPQKLSPVEIGRIKKLLKIDTNIGENKFFVGYLLVYFGSSASKVDESCLGRPHPIR